MSAAIGVSSIGGVPWFTPEELCTKFAEFVSGRAIPATAGTVGPHPAHGGFESTPDTNALPDWVSVVERPCVTAPSTLRLGLLSRTMIPVRRRPCVWSPEPRAPDETIQKVLALSRVRRTVSVPPPGTVGVWIVTFPFCIAFAPVTQPVFQFRTTSFCPYSAAARARSWNSMLRPIR